MSNATSVPGPERAGKFQRSKRADQAAPDTEMVPKTVDGWTLFHGAAEPGWWVKDLDLAAHAGKEPARDIRKVIKTAVDDGALIIALSERDDETPLVRVVEEVVSLGKGGARPVTTYYLNLEGAILILGRLRTPKAIAANKAVVMVFAKVLRGEAADVDMVAVLNRLASLEMLYDNSRQEVAVLRARIEILDPTTDGLAGKVRADYIRGLINHAARLACIAAGEVDNKGVIEPKAELRRRKEEDNALRRVLGFALDIGQGWEALPLPKFCEAMSHLVARRARGEKDVARVRASLEAKTQQLELATSKSLRVVKTGAARAAQTGGTH